MVLFIVLIIIILVVFTSINEGLLTAITMSANVFLAGLVAFNFFEPVAQELDGLVAGSFLEGCEDALALGGLFALSVGLLKLVTSNMADQEIDMPALPQQIASGAVAALTGYLLAGFLVVMLATMPIPEKFLGHDPAATGEESGMKKYLPPDRVWLALMHRAGAAGVGPFAQADSTTFDPDGTFSLRYARLRRIKEGA